MHKILVVDDEPDNVEVIVDLLKKEKYRIFFAINGMMAHEVTLKIKPSLVIMDWEMPEMNGIETISLFKADERTKKIPIIMATGKMTSTEHLREAFEAGAIDFIAKPVDKIELLARINSMIKLFDSIKQNEEQYEAIIQQNKEIAQYKEKELQFEIETTSRQLTSSTLKIIKANELFANFLADLSGLVSYVSEEGMAHINKLVKKYQIECERESWEEFEITFEKVHHGFYTKLNDKHPELTPNERRLCAFLRLNMSSKDIASITFQSSSSIKKARYRLRQKLNLEQSENLSNYLTIF